MNFQKHQIEVCNKYNAPFVEAPIFMKIGISFNVKRTLMPVNGLRHALQGDTSGWYIWADEEFSDDPNFFIPLHIEHLSEWCPEVIKYLGLALGWRFLFAPEYEDVWEDSSLLKI